MADAPAKILIVDDERGMREVLTTVLERAGYQVSVAENGEKALSLAGGEIFEVILTDLKMPGGMGGLEVLRAVKDASPDTLVIVLTAFATLEVGIEAMKLGAYDVLLAAQAMRHQLTLITANVSEFSRVKGLLWEDLSK